MSPRSLLGIADLSREDIVEILRVAKTFSSEGEKTSNVLGAQTTMANVFFEPSTRTRSSFEIAGRRLGAHVLNWSEPGSSTSKGESFGDTVRNIAALGVQVMVLRHSASGAAIAASKLISVPVINAGDGQHEHPTQALLDALTLMESVGDLKGKRIAIIGDVTHSRVARSNILCLNRLGARVVVCGPPTLIPTGIEQLGCTKTYRLEEALEGADAAMALRLQNERQGQALIPSAGEFQKFWGLTERRRELLEKCWLLHPGPMNRGIEISDAIADSPRSLVLKQVTWGVTVRMAVLKWCLQ